MLLGSRKKINFTASNFFFSILQCPHCPKTFVSASFANAHLVRRHSNLQDVLSSSSPAAHEEYRVETEKLHNEIKTLKERLNQTERVIRNETSKISFNNEDTYQRDDQYQRYQEEIKNLKTLLFTEIRVIFCFVLLFYEENVNLVKYLHV